MNILKEKIAKAISNHVSLEDTYTYELTRTKSAFEVGTMSLEDFEEWTEENVDDLAKAIVDVLQPQLNDNQQMVLEWLKEEQTKNPELTIFGTLSVLFDESENRFMSLDVIDALNNLSNPQQEGVFQAFSKWALGQEEEK
ncbi:hypothetical protein [Enterococcus casseliflavus]|uniref:hypothetical protein n=1 Tax=Enterococcus casseliflavus TaxID=37734 RepID=UPI003D6A397B